jgi:hypothetical protein
MNSVHVESLQLPVKQFREDTSQPLQLALGPGPRWAIITAEIREHTLIIPWPSSDTTAENVLPQQVRMPGLFSPTSIDHQ